MECRLCIHVRSVFIKWIEIRTTFFLLLLRSLWTFFSSRMPFNCKMPHETNDYKWENVKTDFFRSYALFSIHIKLCVCYDRIIFNTIDLKFQFILKFVKKEKEKNVIANESDKTALSNENICNVSSSFIILNWCSSFQEICHAIDYRRIIIFPEQSSWEYALQIIKSRDNTTIISAL
jgi:hypothetical protein